MFYRLRRSSEEPGYWFEIITDEGQILSASGVFLSRDAVERVMTTISAEAARAKIVDRTLD